ncbi:MAG: phosphoribosylformylglycinamidine cyclo-ligase [SAR86 cluster bacterium]|uniref:Phosphoribosylformylglycinamidine cyclo-ligase n=1 Tax=SAR86 cluster bacterium TaxID=2030880 RepID=A0A2A5C930_9GAMM|nr:GntR family transcriptional regulator [Gammaproteobacteria bacterium AH-315-E17]PCJ40379.1 MAG: phosphoribosylformylglycinamidine cyclo-ligase [SAR86 cluster bacterium]
MKLELDNTLSTPIFQQIVDQIHFKVNTEELHPGDKLPSIRSLAEEHGLAANTVVKAFRQLEFRGLIKAQDRSAYIVTKPDESIGRYQARGVSSDKNEVHQVVDGLDHGLFSNAFCKITEDYLTGNPEQCNVIHADGSGTKSIIAYLSYKETGSTDVFHGISQDSIVMNLDDLLCIGVNGRILLSNTVNRNALNCPGEVVGALIQGSESFLAKLREFGVKIYSGGGETADVGDLTGTIVVDSCAVAVMKKKDVITGDLIQPGLSIVGLSSTGQSAYEDTPNSGIGSNGLTSARHDMLNKYYAENYPESFDENVSSELVYCGPYKLEDPLPNSDFTVGEAILSPTRTYAPVIYKILEQHPDLIQGLIHCSGGAQTKCLKFADKIHFIKDNLFQAPPVFKAIQTASETPWKEMYKVFNMGHRMEVYCRPEDAQKVIDVSKSFNIDAQIIGRTESSAEGNKLSLSHDGEVFEYRP